MDHDENMDTIDLHADCSSPPEDPIPEELAFMRIAPTNRAASLVVGVACLTPHEREVEELLGVVAVQNKPGHTRRTAVVELSPEELRRQVVIGAGLEGDLMQQHIDLGFIDGKARSDAIYAELQRKLAEEDEARRRHFRSAADELERQVRVAMAVRRAAEHWLSLATARKQAFMSLAGTSAAETPRAAAAGKRNGSPSKGRRVTIPAPPMTPGQATVAAAQGMLSRVEAWLTREKHKSEVKAQARARPPTPGTHTRPPTPGAHTRPATPHVNGFYSSKDVLCTAVSSENLCDESRVQILDCEGGRSNPTEAWMGYGQLRMPAHSAALQTALREIAGEDVDSTSPFHGPQLWYPSNTSASSRPDSSLFPIELTSLLLANNSTDSQVADILAVSHATQPHAQVQHVNSMSLLDTYPDGDGDTDKPERLTHYNTAPVLELVSSMELTITVSEGAALTKTMPLITPPAPPIATLTPANPNDAGLAPRPPPAPRRASSILTPSSPSCPSSPCSPVPDVRRRAYGHDPSSPLREASASTFTAVTPSVTMRHIPRPPLSQASSGSLSPSKSSLLSRNSHNGKLWDQQTSASTDNEPALCSSPIGGGQLGRPTKTLSNQPPSPWAGLSKGQLQNMITQNHKALCSADPGSIGTLTALSLGSKRSGQSALDSPSGVESAKRAPPPLTISRSHHHHVTFRPTLDLAVLVGEGNRGGGHSSPGASGTGSGALSALHAPPPSPTRSRRMSQPLIGTLCSALPPLGGRLSTPSSPAPGVAALCQQGPVVVSHRETFVPLMMPAQGKEPCAGGFSSPTASGSTLNDSAVKQGSIKDSCTGMSARRASFNLPQI